MWDPLLSDAEHTGELRVVASGEAGSATISFIFRDGTTSLSMAISCAAC